MTPDDPGARAGWFPDPLGRYDHRYFNGTVWTADVSEDGSRLVDPLGIVPGQGFARPASAPRGSGATLSLVAGIIAMATAWIPFVVVIGFAAAVVAVITGWRARRVTDHSRATAGFVLGIAALGVSAVGIWLTVVTFQEIGRYLEPGPLSATDATCEIVDGTATATGTVTNLASEDASYTVYVDITSESADDIQPDHTSSEVTELADVEPNVATPWNATSSVGFEYDRCHATSELYGPYPFGVPVDRP